MFKNVHYISAGAGTGKTTALVGIISDLVNKQKKDPGRMILTTYTVAAATAFREKARAKLVQDGCVEGAIALDAAQIGTIHSVASTYIKRYWHLLGLSPELVPMDDASSSILMNRTLDTVLNDCDVWLFNKYAKQFGLNKDQTTNSYDYWKTLLKNLFDRMQSYGYGDADLATFKTQTLNFLDATITQNLNQGTLDDFKESEVVKEFLGYETIIDTIASTPKGKDTYRDNVVVVKSILGLNPLDVSLSTIEDLNNYKWGREVAIHKNYKPQYGDSLGFAAIKAEVNNCVSMLVPNESSDIRKVTEKIFDIAAKWFKAYRDAKAELGVIDFSDMEKMFLDLLENHQEVTNDISKSVDYLFVDEFQDSNPIQAKIYDILSNTVTTQSWFVGDQKQAIYGFAGSESALVSELSKIFPAAVKDASSPTGYKKDGNGNSSQILDASWRSAPSLVNLANEVFTAAFKETIGGYTEDFIPDNKVRISPAAGKKDPSFDNIIHIELCDCKNATDRVDTLATAVCKMIQQPQFAANGYTPSDVAILCRWGYSVTNVAGALARRNIPVGFVDTDFISCAEVQFILCALKLSAGISVSKIKAELRKIVDGESFEELVSKCLNGNKSVPFWGGFETFCNEISGHSVLERINEIIIRFDLYNWCGRWGNAAVRRGNIETLRNAASSYTSAATIYNSCTDVRGFLTFLKTFKPDTKFDDSIDGVKVLTYHKSKGLEWKIVILYDLFGEYKDMGTISKVNILGTDPMRPAGMYAIPELPGKAWDDLCIGKNPKADTLKRKSSAKAIGEEKRLLYVGVTRAKDVLITVGIDDGLPKVKKYCPTVRSASMVNVGGKIDIWGVPGCESRYISVSNDPTLKMNVCQNAVRYADAGLYLQALAKGEKKYHSPSKYVDEQIQKSTIVKMLPISNRTDITHHNLEDNEFGDCIHHIFAVCNQGDEEGNIRKAERTLNSFGIGDPTAATKVAACIDKLYVWLEKEYGKAVSVDRELPFRYTDDSGNVFSGNMDMVWNTADGCVLVDYKTFSGQKEEVEKSDSKFWAGHYASQQSVYSSALSREGHKVLAKLLFYPILGVVVELVDKPMSN